MMGGMKVRILEIYVREFDKELKRVLKKEKTGIKMIMQVAPQTIKLTI